MRRAASKRIAVAALAALLVALATGSALAYFTTTGAGEVSAAVTKLNAPTISAATPGVGGTVALTWGAVTPPSTGSVTYYVSRDGEAPAGTCPTSESPVTVTSCTDKGLEPGIHSYTVTARWRSWGATGSPASAKVTVGPATHFSLTAASSTPTAGVADNLTITAQDVNNSTVTTYAGSHSLTFSGASASPGGTAPTVSNSSGTAVAFGAATAISFASGIAVVNTTKNGVMKLYRAGASSVSVTDGSLTNGSALAVTVAPAALSKLALTAESATPSAGAGDDLTIVAQDAYANTATAYAGSRTVTFTGASASPNGTIPTVSDSSEAAIPFGSATTIEFSAGIATATGSDNGEMRLFKSGATSIKVTDGTVSTATNLSVIVAAGAAVKLALTATSPAPVAGAADNLTTTAQDVFGNAATSYAGLHELTFSGASASPGGTAPTVSNSSGTATVFGTATPITFTSGVATVSSTKNGVMRLYRAEASSISVTDGTLSNAPGLAVTVATAALSKLALTAESTVPVAGAADDLTIAAQDAYANTIASYTGAHNLTFTGASASPNGTVPTVSDSSEAVIPFGTATMIEFSAGIATASGSANGEMHLCKSGATSIKVTDGTVSSATNLAVTVAAGAASKLVLTASSLTPAAGAAVNLTTTAQDPYGNTAVSYAGLHSITFSGPSVSPGGTAPTIVDSAGTVTSFGAPTSLNFSSGVAAVGSSKNGLMRLYRAESVGISATDGALSSPAALAVTVSTAAASKLALANVTISAGSLGSPCFFTCTVTSLGNGGTVQGAVAVTDTYGNTVSGIGTGHTVAVTTVGGAVSGGSLAIPSTGPAESSTQFLFTAQASGAFTDSVKAATSAGTVYSNATLTATR